MTTNKTATESSQGEVSGGAFPPPSTQPPAGQKPEHFHGRGGNVVLKSGPLFISSKGIGWTSWKKRWFILTKTSLVFFRTDPNAAPPKGGEVNLTLGGIDLNNSGSVVVKADKKLLTVIFPDGRAFTLKAEALDDLNEWKTALEEALSQAPSAGFVMGQNGIFKSNHADGADGSVDQLKDKQPVKSLVIGRPILLALEDIDGSPSFLEKALRFIEDHGIKFEGILRQAADVDDVMRRIREYEEGKTEFSAEEDAHVIGDCIKYFLRELLSSPVPASCCNALVEACRTDRSKRVNAMREAICETFPEPNRKLLQRILLMMQVVASNKDVNRMSTSAVAACMAPLLLRPLLSGDCEIATDFNVGGDSSMQLLQAAAAANHAQAIVITLLEEYENIFRVGTISPGLYSNSEEGESEDEEEVTDEDDDEYYEDDENDEGTQESDAYTDDKENASSGTGSENVDSGEDDFSDDEGSDDPRSGSVSAEDDPEIKDQSSSGSVKATSSVDDDTNIRKSTLAQNSSSMEPQTSESGEFPGIKYSGTIEMNKPTVCHPPIQKSTTIANDPELNARHPTVWGRTPAKKSHAMESFDLPREELEIQKLEATRLDLQNRISEEVKGNAVLQANLEQRKKALHEHRLALEKDVARLQDQLQKEREKRKALEAGLSTSRECLSSSVVIDDKGDLEEITQVEADITNLKKKVDEPSEQLSQQHKQKPVPKHESSEKLRHPSNHRESKKDRQKITEEGALPPQDKSASKEVADIEDDKKHQLESTTGKHGHQDQQLDSAVSSNSRSNTSTNSRRSRTRAEGTDSTSSSLSKLTNRLNFLKEQHTQIANELHHQIKGRISDLGLTIPNMDRGVDLHHSVQVTHKGHESEVQPSTKLQKGRGLEGLQSLEDAEKALQVEGQSLPDNGKDKTPDGQLPQNVGGRKQSESQRSQVLNRGNFEGRESYNADKAKGSSSKPRSTPRTKSR